LGHYESIEDRTYRSFDGTLIQYSVAGRTDGKTLILANGLGGNIVCWQHLIEHFGASHRLICWDYRGLYASAPARNGSYTIADHVNDLECLLDAESVNAPVIIGWSMGVQVGLEFERQHPGRASGLVLLNGTPGKPYKTVFNRNLERELSLVGRQLQRHWHRARYIRRGKGLVTRKPLINAFITTVQHVGLAAASLDRNVFSELGIRWVELDLDIYARIFNRLAEHDATDMLESVSIPVLVVGGANDRMTPIHRSELMADRIPGAELCVISKGTHFSPIEYPDIINLKIRRFLSQRVTRSTNTTLSLIYDASQAS